MSKNNVFKIKQYNQQLGNPKTHENFSQKQNLKKTLPHSPHFPYNDCIYHRCGYFKPCKSFQFKANDKFMIWHYKRYFNCDSKNVMYIMMCNTCGWFYLRQTNNLKQRIRKHKSDVFHPQNSFCKKCSEHLRKLSQNERTCFQNIPIFR